LAEPIRWIFQYTGTPFVDERIPWDYPKWFTETKAKFASTVGQIPVLHEVGNPAELTQAQAISRYLAKKFNLHGDDDRQNFRVDEVVGMVYDLFIWWRMMLIFEKDPERKKYQKAMTDAKFALYYARWNKMLEESGGDYLLGKKLTHADFWLANFISMWDDPLEGDEPIMPPGYAKPSQSDIYVDLTKGYPALRAHKERIHAIPQIKAWIAIRHKTIC